ncbi:MAG: DNA polymerase I [Oscillospiraceae bacterium]|nr:DNA polymerase I [Oscillospiraceae bacterium]
MKLMAIDGNSIVNRAFYGIRELNAPDGTPTNAVYGFLAILRRLWEEEKPDGLCVAFDRREPTFRHRSYDFYKAQRKPMPEELAVQMPVLKELLDSMQIRRLEMPGYEADDILGTLSRMAEEMGDECVVVTGDRDALQLVSDRTKVCNVKSRMGRTETIPYTPERFREEYGFDPGKIVDLKALMGDSSDNIPGVPGIGEKTAMDLLQRFGSLEEIYRDVEGLDVKPGVKNKLASGEESARSSYWLATIFRAVPLENFSLQDCRWELKRTPALLKMMKRLGFRKMIEQWRLTELETEAGSGAQAGAGAETEPAADASQPAAGTAERAEENGFGATTVREITSQEELEALTEKLKAASFAAVELLKGTEELSLCLAETPEQVWVLRHLELGEACESFLRLLFSASVPKAGHHIKDLMNVLNAEGLTRDGFVFDTALAAYLLRATDSDYDLPGLALRYLGRELDGAAAVARLVPVLRDRLAAENMTRLFEEVELPLCSVLSEMEETGFLVDRRALAEFGESLNADIDRLQEEIYALAGHEFNILSPKQLGTVLFEELALPAGKKTKTGWSTNVDVLEKLQAYHPIAGKILDYRTLSKLKSTYAEGLLKVIAPDGRIHTSFQMTVTATGRLSSTEPNLQNIPIRKEVGARIRTMFAAPAGKMLVDADYSQIELRLLAHISDDKAMQEAFLSGEDFHTVTASKVFNVPLDEVSHTLRSRAKAVNFGIVYGISAFSLAQDIGVRQAEAKEYMDAYLRRYSGVRDYMHAIVEQAKRDGYVTTLWGRRRELPELRSPNRNMRAFGERVALNMPIQGTAADIIKLAMVHVNRRLKQECPEAKLVLQVHDELIVECPEALTEQVSRILKEEMENVTALSVPLTAEVQAARTWAEAH